MLVDTGDDKPACLEMLCAALNELKVSMDNTDIFLTHLHTDHLGLVPYLATESTRVFMGSKDVARQLIICTPKVNDDTREKQRRAGFSPEEIELCPLLKPDSAFISPFINYIGLDEGAELEYGGYKFVTIETPGHTPGHMCLYDKEHKIMIVGDHVLFSITPNISNWSGVKDPLGDYVKSLMKVRDYDVKHLLTAHRDVTGELAERVDEIIEHHGVRVRETLDVLDANPGLTAYEIAGHMQWNIRYSGDWSNFPIQQKSFAVYEICAHLDYLVQRGRARREEIDGVDYFYPIKTSSGFVLE